MTRESGILEGMKNLKLFFNKNIPEVIIFFSSLFLYGITSSRTIVHGDSGDFLSAAATAGIPHPSGYPLYTLLARIIFLLPLGNPVWQVNLLSSFFASLTLVFVYKTVFKLTHSLPAGLFSVFCLGIFESFWFYALVSQIHILQVFILSLLFYFLISFTEEKKINHLYAAFFMFGLGASNNLSIIFTLPSLLIALVVFRKKLSVIRLVKLFLISVLGLTPYLYIWYAAVHNSPTSWGGVHDLYSFFRLVSRQDYGTLVWVKPESWMPFEYSTSMFFWIYLFKTSWFSLLFFIASFFFIPKKITATTLLFLPFLLLGPGFYTLMNLSVRNIVYVANATQYYSYSYLFFSILCGIGVFVVLQKLKYKNNLIPIVLICIIFLPLFFLNFSKVRQNTDNLAEVTTKFQLSQLPKNAVLLTSGDSIGLPGRYWQYVLNYRQDIIIIEGGLLNFPWYANHLEKHHENLEIKTVGILPDFDSLCKKYAKNGKLFVYPWFPEFDAYFKKNCKVIPYGLVAKVIPKDEKADVDSIKKMNDDFWNTYRAQTNIDSTNTTYFRDREGLFYLGEQLDYLGIYYLNNNKPVWAYNAFKKAREISQDEVNSIIGESALLFHNNRLNEGIEILEAGVQKNPAQPELYKNLGLFYEKMKNPEKTYEYFKDYIEFKPVTDPDASNIESYVKNYEYRQYLK